jgi:hypothetical protein
MPPDIDEMTVGEINTYLRALSALVEALNKRG